MRNELSFAGGAFLPAGRSRLVKTPHAPGPWVAHRSSDRAWHVTDNGGEVVAAYGGEANARLIAAAPVLLTALRDLLEWGREHTSPRDENSPHQMLIAAAAAVAAADGEEPAPLPPVDDRFPVADWQYEVANEDTRLGYDAWLANKQEQRRDQEQHAHRNALLLDACEAAAGWLRNEHGAGPPPANIIRILNAGIVTAKKA